MTNVENMPMYQSHKRVRALEIAAIENGVDGKPRLYFTDGENFQPMAVDPLLTMRYSPKIGDFFVVYEDGYESLSPRKAFLDGYTRVVTNFAPGSPVIMEDVQPAGPWASKDVPVIAWGILGAVVIFAIGWYWLQPF